MAVSKYYAKFSGQELDKAIEYILKFKNEFGVTIIGSTIDTKVDLNTLKEDGVYVIHYYENSYDVTLSSSRIELQVFRINSDILCQRYDSRGDTVQRYYSESDMTWSEWAPVKNILSVEEDEVVSVGKPTLVLRHYNGNASEDYPTS